MRSALVVVALAFSTVGRAQVPDSLATVTGRILDALDSGAVAGAEISIPGTDRFARADGRGFFRLSGIPIKARELSVRALGYARLTQSEDFSAGATLKRDIYMVRVPGLLQQVVIHGRSMRVPHGFEEIYRRGAQGYGTFITREQIDSINPQDLKTMFRQIAGVVANDKGVYFQRCLGSQTGQLWVDGQRVTRFAKMQVPGSPITSDPYFMNELLTSIRPTEVQAVEVYTSHATVPGDFLDAEPCAVIAVWTKRGP